MTADERLALIHTKVERAKEHLRNLETEIRAFLVTNPYVVGTKSDPQTRQLIYYLVSVRQTPITMPVIASDVLHNLRSALDHLAYQLVLVGGAIPTKQTYFPISDDASKYKTESPRKVKGMRPAAVKAIDAIKPYKGGDDTLWRLHKLNNVDKHRTLITVGSAFRSFDLGPVLQREMVECLSGHPDPDIARLADVPRMDYFLKPSDRMFPLEQEDELFIDVPDAKVHDEMQFRFDIAFSEPQIAEGEALLETLVAMADRVDDLVTNFKPLLI